MSQKGKHRTYFATCVDERVGVGTRDLLDGNLKYHGSRFLDLLGVEGWIEVPKITLSLLYCTCLHETFRYICVRYISILILQKEF